MKTAQAYAEARRRWGADGFAWEGRWGLAAKPPIGRYRVGVWSRMLGGPRRYGHGNTFEAAFIDAERDEAIASPLAP